MKVYFDDSSSERAITEKMPQTFVERPRLIELLRSRATRRVTLLGVPEGFGVSTILEEYRPETTTSYVCLRERTSLARLAGDLVDAMASFVPGIQWTLAAAYERALWAEDPPDALAAWFARHAQGVACTIVLDHLHHAASPAVTRFIVRAVERSPESCRWILASRTLDDVPVASWLAHGVAGVPLAEDDLRLTREEAFSFAEQLEAQMDDAEVARLHAFTRGRAADFVFLLRAQRSGSGRHGEHESTEHAIEAIYYALTRAERYFVVRTSLLTALVEPMLESVAGARARPLLDRLQASHPELFDDDGLRYQGRFRQYLHGKLQGWSRPRRLFVVARTAAALEAAGDVAGALHLFISIRFQAGILRLVERHGFSSIESSNASIVHDAIEALDDEARAHNHAVLALLAISAALNGTTDVSESLFQHALAACRTDAQEIHVRYLYACELLRRGRHDAVALLKPDVKFMSAPPELRVTVMSALGAAYVLEDRMTDAQKWIDRALSACARLTDDALSARVHHQAAFVALHARDAERATRLATKAAELADAAGAYEVASGACSVLYQIAADLEDDPGTAARYLQRIAVYAAKCGNVEKQMFAWVGAYEIEVERGNSQAAADIERALNEFDLQYGSHIISEALVSAQVLQASWSGDFERAHQTLGFSADQQWTADREALRWTEIAVYAAAAGSTEKAAGAVVSALRKLKSAPRDGVRTLRARLYCALAFVLLGRTSAPRMMLAAVARDLPRHRVRLRALATAIERLAAFRADEADDHHPLLAALEALHRSEFGGVARMLEALPLDVAGHVPLRVLESA